MTKRFSLRLSRLAAFFCVLPLFLGLPLPAAARDFDADLADARLRKSGELLLADYDGEGAEAKMPDAALVGAGASDLPRAFSLLDVDGASYVTSVKSQGSTGLCWAYAALGSCESNIAYQGLDIPEEWYGEEDELDLSEGALGWYIYTEAFRSGNFTSGDYIYLDGKGVGGGNVYIAAAALAANGAQLERIDSFDDWELGYSEYQRYASYYRLRSADILESLPRGGEEIIKSWLRDTGAVAVSYYADDRYYDNGTTTSYYQTGANEATHAVLVVGWDDDYSKDNFFSYDGSRPQHDGAWLCRNSWGSGVTDAGYFWMSYEEPSLCDWARFLMTEQTDHTTYQYDGGVSYSGLRIDCAGNIYTAEADSTLTEIMFPIAPMNPNTVRYTVSIYLLDDTADNPKDGVLAASQDGTVYYGGYKSVTLETPVQVKKGQRFSATIAFRGGAGERTPYTAIESNLESVVETYAACAPGQSYIYDEGVWRDMTEVQKNPDYSYLGNVSLKVIGEETVSADTAELERLLDMAKGETDALCQEAYALGQAVLAEEDAQQWEIDNAAKNLLAGLEKVGALAYPKWEYESKSYSLGDVDGDGETAVHDAHLALMEYARMSSRQVGILSPWQTAAADLTADGLVEVVDAQDILERYAGIAVGIAFG